jgi:hypothetical protein
MADTRSTALWLCCVVGGGGSEIEVRRQAEAVKRMRRAGWLRLSFSAPCRRCRSSWGPEPFHTKEQRKGVGGKGERRCLHPSLLFCMPSALLLPCMYVVVVRGASKCCVRWTTSYSQKRHPLITIIRRPHPPPLHSSCGGTSQPVRPTPPNPPPPQPPLLLLVTTRLPSKKGIMGQDSPLEMVSMRRCRCCALGRPRSCAPPPPPFLLLWATKCFHSNQRSVNTDTTNTQDQTDTTNTGPRPRWIGNEQDGAALDLRLIHPFTV